MPQTDAPVAGGQGGSRLRWWTELPLIIVVYAAYSLGRMLVRSDQAVATTHGLDILSLERTLHISVEEQLNRLVSAHLMLGLPADFWYASLHYLVTPAIAVWVYRTRPEQYRKGRTWLLLSTFIGLIGFTLLPTCPPRLLADRYGFTDTMAKFSHYGWWGGAASAPRGLGHMTNQFAAMPSLHVGWALWCGLMLWRYGPRNVPARAAAVGYPLVTTLVVMGTANHYLLDAVAGIIVMGVGLLLTRPALRLTGAARTRYAGRLAPARAAVSARVAAVRSAVAVRTAGKPVRGGGGRSAVTAWVAAVRARRAGGSPIVGDECKTSAGERIPGQRSRPARRAEPAARGRASRGADADDGAAAAAR